MLGSYKCIVRYQGWQARQWARQVVRFWASCAGWLPSRRCNCRVIVRNKDLPTPVSCLHSRVALSIDAAFLQAQGARKGLEGSSLLSQWLLLLEDEEAPELDHKNVDAHKLNARVLALTQSPTVYHTNTTAAHPTSMDRARRYLMQQASSQTAKTGEDPTSTVSPKPGFCATKPGGTFAMTNARKLAYPCSYTAAAGATYMTAHNHSSDHCPPRPA